MRRALLVGLVLTVTAAVAIVLLRGREQPASTTTTAQTATTAVKAYFFRGGGLVPVTVRVPRTQAVATAALGALLAGPPRGYTTAIPAGTRLRRLAVAGGIASAEFTRELAGAPRTARGQIVYTLTRFPTVRTVEVAAAGEESRSTRADYVDLTPSALIFVATPARDSTVKSPLRVAGTAIAFEATIRLEARSAGRLVHAETITASQGGPYRGTWSTVLHLDPGSYDLVLYEPSAADGSHLHTTVVPIRVQP
jgi:hypothetical protein